MNRKIGTACMTLGAALVLSALSLFLWNLREDQAAGTAVNHVMPQVIRHIESPSSDPPGEEPESEPSALPDPYDPAMTEVEIDGYGYIGCLSIPALKLELPVMSQWDYARLKIAPCRYTGSTKTGDLVICGHNYVRHFGPISNLTPGDQVTFTDMDGVALQYEVASIDTLPPTDVDDMTAGDYDLTLFTCTYSGTARITVRCEQK